jgi:hypothetical protein
LKEFGADIFRIGDQLDREGDMGITHEDTAFRHTNDIHAIEEIILRR